MNKRILSLLVITPLLLSSELSTSHAAVKAGAKCTKAGITQVVKNKSYTCVKTGNKLVWNKGVKVQRTPTGNTANAAAKAGAKCSKVGVKSVVGAKTFTCTKNGKKLVWNKGVLNVKSTPKVIDLTFNNLFENRKDISK